MSFFPLWIQVKRDPLDIDDLLRRFDAYRPPVDVIGLAKGLGVKVMLVHGANWDGAVESDGTGKATIYVNVDGPEVRQRFTVAHELGHLLMHETGVAFRDVFAKASMDPKELEASAFAVDLLAPSVLVQTYATVWPIDNLYQVFDVSPELMDLKLRGIGYDRPWWAHRKQ